MRKRLLSMAIFLLLFTMGGLINARPCLAASAKVEISADSSEITVGDDIFVYINITSDTLFGDFEANLTYDPDILEYAGGSPVISGNSGFLKIYDIGVSEGTKSRKYSLEFEALQVGMCELAFDRRAVVYDFDTGYEMSVSSNVLTLNVKAPETASANANLKSLKTGPVDITPAFDANITEYNVNVDNAVQQLVITALPEDSKARVSISGNDFLKEGENKVIITVLAESGDIIKYNINVFREYAPEEGTPEDSAISPDTVQRILELVEIDGVKYAVYSGRYTIVEPDSTVTIPEGYKLGSLKISDITIPAYLPVNNEVSEFVLIYAENDFGKAGFYQYDRTEKTLQRYVPDSVIINSGTDNSNSLESTQTEEYNANLSRAAVAIALLSALSVLLILIAVRLFMKLKGYKEDDLD